jgi:uncharacterized damage-inducible protein DinB
MRLLGWTGVPDGDLEARWKGARMRWIVPAVCLTSLALPLLAQTSDAGADKALSPSLATTAKAMHASIRRNIAEAAEAMPAENYGFKPAPEIRTFAQLVGHVTNANLLFCSASKGAPFPSKINAETLATKEAALKALTDALAYCDAAYQEVTDANFGERATISGFGNKPTETTRGAILMFNTTHNNEHYGNIVVYLRLREIVPPSTRRVQPNRK